MSLLHTWRWYGPNDMVSLDDVLQAGAKGIVNALHHIPVGEVWSVEEIQKRKRIIEWDEKKNKARDLKWSVVESVNIHESIKKGSAERDQMIENYIQTIKNLSECGVYTVCYNFMPILDWTRTDLVYEVEDGSKALRFDAINLAAFDLFILKRPEAKDEYIPEVIQKAQERFDSLNQAERELLQKNVLAGLPGTTDIIEIEDFRKFLAQYEHVDAAVLKSNLKYFLERVVPEAEKAGIKLCCHPDDPPYPIFGLPRIISNEEDLTYLTSCVDSPSNGITFCTGSLGPNASNDLPGMIKKLGHKIHFLHLRNVQRQADGSFYEADHLTGSTDMYAVMLALVKEVKKRKESGRDDFAIPMRPDHGHQMLDDLKKHVPFAGYSAIGRLRGLAELRGLELGISRTLESI
ncbi:mannonate dehydratase [Reichenbachiella sp. MALMAid0571]|uniref:mannonate dehydratase n=1 Tax=Reichenbachiella sp. MALMAid0571 TaxID=3143939 RepID=UPI0032E0430D